LLEHLGLFWKILTDIIGIHENVYELGPHFLEIKPYFDCGINVGKDLSPFFELFFELDDVLSLSTEGQNLHLIDFQGLLEVIKFIQSWNILLDLEIEVHSVPSSLNILDLLGNLLLFLGNIDDLVDLGLEVMELQVDDISESRRWGGNVNLFTGESKDFGPMSGLHSWVQKVTDQW